MSDVDNVLRESILGVCGLGGVLRFNALYAGSFEKEDGGPDLEGIRTAVCKAFPPEQAEAVTTVVAKKLEIIRKARETAAHPAQGQQAAAIAAKTPGKESPEGDAIFARYFQADPNHVRDIVNEARRMRAAMGKSIAMQPAAPVKNVVKPGAPREKAAEKHHVVETAPVKATEEQKPVQEAVRTPAMASPQKPDDAAAQVSTIDAEIEQFAYGQTAYSSIDIMDFIRYMKDKGYSFQEYIVLEKIYVKIEERKKEARSAIEKEVEGLFNGAQAPEEPDICGLIKRLRDAGMVFEEEDVRRMARVAALRRI